MESRQEIFACVGPESTGKSTVCNRLASHFNGALVPEFARNYLDKRNGKYSQSDLLNIAEGQLNSEQRVIGLGKSPIFCDTDILVIKIWHEFKYGEQNSEINELLCRQQPRKYLLTYPDLEWTPDPLRENPNDLLELFQIYESELQYFGAEYRVIKGKNDVRTLNAIEAINQMKLG